MFSRLAGRIFDWIDERWPLSLSVRLALEEEMAGGNSYAYVFGSSALIIFLLQVVTGIWQLFYYVPILGHGYNSLNYLRTEVPFGWLIHGLHFWGATAMVVLVMLHMSQVFLWGAYKRPHELQWISGVFLFFLTMAMSLTGGALPWDKRSYWLVEVASSAAGTVPVVGDFIKRIMLGGGVIGQLTLSRFFILHAAILSGALLILAVFHLVALRKVGNAGPWDDKKRAEKGPFWPDQVFKDGLAASLIILLLVGLSAFLPPPFAGMADPLDASYIPKPEWNFLFFYQLLKFFPGRLEVIATVGIPAIGALVLLLIPFADRAPERSPLRRPVAMAGWLAAVVMFVAFTLAGAYSKPEGMEAAAAATAAAPAAPAGPSAGEKAGKELFQSLGCVACHRIDGAGGSIGPDLSGEGLRGRSKDWLENQIRNPKSNNPASVMPPFAALDRDKVGQLIDYLLSLREKAPATGPAAAGGGTTVPAAASPATAVPAGPQGEPGMAAGIIGSADHGGILFANACTSCHGPEGTGKIANPGSKDGTVPPLNPVDRDEFSPDPEGFAAKIDRYIQHGSRPEGPNPGISMPPFGDTHALTQQQIADIEAYILRLNGVDRAAVKSPGIAPEIFFPAAAVLFVLAGLTLWGWWRFAGPRKRKRKGMGS
jgi:ubiquinol-cytochrome c reductase cytochrome b subunit